MRILIANTRHFRGGGDSTYTFNLADLLRRKGHEVAFFAMEDERNIEDPNSDLFVSNIDFKDMNRKKGLINGIEVLTRVIYSKGARRKFATLLDRVKPDILHLQNIHGHISPSIIFEAKDRGIPVVWSLHDYKMLCPNSHFFIDLTEEICESCNKSKYYYPIIKKCKKGSFLASLVASIEAYAYLFMEVSKKIDAFLCPSIFLRNKLIENDFPAEKVFYLQPFVPVKEKNDEPIESSNVYFLFMSRIEPIKGIWQLIEACRQAPEISVKLVGSINKSIEHKFLNNLPDNVEYLGFKSDFGLQHILSNSLAVVAPYLTYEMVPISILEAFSSGKPVIASDLGTIKEIVIDKKYGLLIKAGDSSALALAMRWMKAHPHDAKKMGDNAQKAVVEQNNPETHLNLLLNIYKKVMTSQRN